MPRMPSNAALPERNEAPSPLVPAILGMGPVLHSDWAQRNVSSLASEFMAYVEATGAFQLTTSEAELRE